MFAEQRNDNLFSNHGIGNSRHNNFLLYNMFAEQRNDNLFSNHGIGNSRKNNFF